MMLISQDRKIKVDSRDIEEITVERITGTDARSIVAETETRDFILATYPNRQETIDAIKLFLFAAEQEDKDNIGFTFPPKMEVSAV